MTERKPLVGHFDAKKHAYRQTQDGVVISFVVDPADITPEFAAAPLGTTLKIGYAEYDPETGQAKEAPKAEKPKKRELSPSQECAMYCKRPEFQSWLGIQPLPNEDAADVEVKRRLGIKSKTELDRDWNTAERWRRMRTSFDFRNTPALERG